MSSSTNAGGQDDQPSLNDLLRHDAEALAAVTRGYAGGHDILDAVWWREHPLTDTPDGRTDPAAGLAGLKARAFSRQGSPADVEALAEAERRVRRDAEALERALQDARPQLAAAADRLARSAGGATLLAPAASSRAGLRSDGREPHDRVPDDRVSADSPADPADPTDPADPAALAWRRRSLVWMWTSIAAGLLLLLGVGFVVEQQLNPRASLLGAGAATGADGAAAATPSADPNPPGLDIFENPGLAPTDPPASIDPYYKPESLRLLGVADSELTVYAVENRIDQPCLLAVYDDGTQTATCVTKQEFASMGIELRITSLRVTRPGDPAPYRSIAQDVVFWNPDGTYGTSSSPSSSTMAGGTAGGAAGSTPTPTSPGVP